MNLIRREKNNKIAQDLKFLDLVLLVFEKHSKINKKTPNLKFGTKFNRENIIYEKEGFEKSIKDSNPITKNTD